MENMNTALGLLLVGMVTVIIILCLVVVIGNLVIRLTNRFIPEAGLSGGSGSSSGGVSGGGAAAGRKVHPKKLAVIVAAVDMVTQGRGRVDSIEKKTNK